MRSAPTPNRSKAWGSATCSHMTMLSARIRKSTSAGTGLRLAQHLP
ncbi:monooxygenase domain protein [Mycobacterium xenopi 3993]|nr:monooxygenase domain protein [Mycobacterium xenopi 3993]